MPAGKPAQSNAMLYTLITFVALFLVAAVAAFIFYLKAEEYRTENINIADDIAKLAARGENPDAIVGKRVMPETGRNQLSYLGTMNQHLNEMISYITGNPPGDAAAAVKVNETKIEINALINAMGQDAQMLYGPDGIDLVQAIRNLKIPLDDARNKAKDMENSLLSIQDEFDLALENFQFEEEKLQAQLTDLQAQYDQVNANYEQLKQSMQMSADQQIQDYMDRLEKSEERLELKNIELANTQQELATTKESLQTALQQLEEIKPQPDIEVLAFRPDARIIEVDRQTSVVYLDVGSDSHVYVGLTFSVYDKNKPIPEDGKGKAEIEVFDVTKTISAARINNESKRNPIVRDDIVANLIWDSESSNTFVVAGDFDFDGDGVVERDGTEKNIRLIEYWGGTLNNAVSINTDFVLLGERPEELPEPTRAEIDIDPTIEQKYLASVERAKRYDMVLSRATTLAVPVFNQQRFLHLIGYQSLAAKTNPL